MSNALACCALALLPMAGWPGPWTQGIQESQGHPEELPRVLVLGTFHMDNPGLDYINPEVDDVLQEHRQEEIEELVERLLRFEPTKIAVERTPAAEAALNGRYRAFLEGAVSPSRDEIFQIGYRLAAAMGHERLYPVDHRQDMQLGQIMARAQDQPSIAERLERRLEATRAHLDPLMKLPVVEVLREMNSAKADREHDVYLLMAQVGTASDPVGAEGVSGWYARNLKIFANVARLAREPDDRILVLIGAGHGTLLRDFVRQAPNLELEDTLSYLR